MHLASINPRPKLAEAAMAEPLAVCLHAAGRAGALQGRRVLVTGCGPIGALLVLVARHAGAAEIVATDVADHPLAVARAVGATRTINVAAEPEALAGYEADCPIAASCSSRTSRRWSKIRRGCVKAMIVEERMRAASPGG